METGSSYKNIFKTTFLFGFVQVFNIVTKVVINKVVAVLLGAEGMGIIGLFNSAIRMIQTGAGLGISQSAVRDISEANGANDYNTFSKTISLTNKVILLTSLLGVVVTIILAPFLSKWSFGNSAYTISFVWLSFVVGLNILSEGQLAILKGMRQLHALAKASIIGSVVGLVSAVPFYYFFGKGGIIPSLMVSAFSSLFFSNYYVRKVKFDRIKIRFKQLICESRQMVVMGVSLMLVSFMASVFDLVVSSFISHSGSLADVGFYHAGTTIIGAYFGVIITAMTTDYYPRISAINKNNEKLLIEMNKQSEAGLVMIFPLVVLFIFLSRYFVIFLYSDNFLPTIDYTDYAMIGTVITVVSNCMGMILLAKQASKIFIISVIAQRIVNIIIYLVMYNLYGLFGLGLSYIALSLIHLLLMSYIMEHFYKVHLVRRVLFLLVLVLGSTILCIVVRGLEGIVSYVLGSVLLCLVTLFSYIYMKRYMQIDMIVVFKNKIRRK